MFLTIEPGTSFWVPQYEFDISTWRKFCYAYTKVTVSADVLSKAVVLNGEFVDTGCVIPSTYIREWSLRGDFPLCVRVYKGEIRIYLQYRPEWDCNDGTHHIGSIHHTEIKNGRLA